MQKILNKKEIIATFQSFVSNKKELIDIPSSLDFAFAPHFVDLTKHCLDSAVVYNDMQHLQIESILDFLHGQLYTGKRSSIELKFRRAFSVASFVKTMISLSSGYPLEKCLKSLDLGLLLGAPLTEKQDLLTKGASLLSKEIIKRNGKSTSALKKRSSTDDANTPAEKKPCRRDCNIFDFTGLEATEIETVDCLSPVKFHSDYLVPQKPVKITGCMKDWSAMTKWKDVDYLLKLVTKVDDFSRIYNQVLFGTRWSFGILKLNIIYSIRPALIHFEKETPALNHAEAVYRIPELRKDIDILDYCNFSHDDCDPDINTWFGPKGTVSPLHYDMKNNILAQVFGTKQILLFSPKDTPYLYPHEDKLLSNTAKVDPLQPDLTTCPEFNSATMYKCLLGPGEFLFLPQKWWHHVTALDKSYSVSFWWF